MVHAFDLEPLERAARDSEQGEHYTVVAGSADRRLGVGARRAKGGGCKFFIEVSVQLCQRGSGFDIPALRNAAVLLQSLKSMGYDLSCEIGLVSCEKTLARCDAVEELAAVREMMGL